MANPQATGTGDIVTNEKQSSQVATCNGAITTCGYLKKLCEIMKQYEDIQCEKNADDILEKYDQNMVNIINYFHHFLECHDQKNADFEYIYKLFGGNCPFIKCDIFKRHYNRKRRESKLNHNLLYIQTMLDQIHCHIRHQYDVGSRFTKHQLHELTANGNKIIENLKNRRIMLAKNINFETETSQTNIINNNKFVSKKLVQTTHSKTYSYSYPFNYWIQCEECNDSCLDGMTYSDLYIPPKYADLKEELLEHSGYFQFVSDPTIWLLTAQKELIIKTERIRKIKANCEQYLVKMKDFADHPSKYGYKDGDILKENNIAVIKIYCAEDMFQNAFSKTYRPIDDDEKEEKKDDNESFESIKKRHREYHHFARLLRETVEVFGTEYMNGNIKRMYHGVRGEMLLPGFQCKIFGVLSTTFEYSVAVQFSCNNGLVLELVPDAHLKYFDCRFLSPWSYESELLFIGGLARFNIMNIICLYQIQSNHEPYVKALRVIDSMTNGIYFSNDAADIHKIKANDWCINTEELGFKDISNEIKGFVQQFIDYRLSDKCDGNTYVTKLLNKICDTKKCILINWASINHGKLEIIDIDGAYIGYEFVKSKICKTKMVGTDGDGKEICYIDIEKINELFPSMISLVILELSFIESAFLDDILSLFKNNKNSKINCIELTITNDPLVCTNIQSQFENYQHKFKNIKKEFSKKLETDKIVIKRDK